MKRLIYNKLLEWKSRIDHKPLVLEGARQVGKTYILQEFGRNEFENMVYISCENNDTIKELFAVDYNIDRIIRGLENYSLQSIVPGKTLLVLDEIQELPGGIPSLKYFCENARSLHVAVAGSLLGIFNLQGQSFPVGKVDIIHLYPLTFHEFLMARGKDMLVDTLKSLDWSVISPLHQLFADELRQYYFVGGMPEVVLKYIETGDALQVRNVQESIIDAYMRDFAKHAGKETQRVRLVWDSIPSHLARENKKFIFGAVKSGARASFFDNAIQWLQEAGLLYKVENLRQIELPLKFYSDRDAFKAFLLDVGLLGAMTLTPPNQTLVKDNVFTAYKGAFTENYVLALFKAIGNIYTFYYSKANSTLEIDFVCQIGDRIVPIEAKAETNVKAKSLSTFAKTNNNKVEQSLRFSMRPYVDQGWMQNVPLYAIEAFMEDYVVNSHL
ncbi:MAG: ATP-binding protein [Muribaculaceae bacterium]|nr:ATP-binding protein [Muribaculaceae bacterium]